MKNRILLKEKIIEKPIEVVFNFFSKAENLNLITPDHLHFKIITPIPIKMEVGTLIDYQLKLFYLPFKWKTKITEWNPPYCFTDTQWKGPYARWIHRHTFESIGNKTLMKDRVEYLSPGWIAEPIIHHLFVKNKLETIFNYREQNISNFMKEMDL